MAVRFVLNGKPAHVGEADPHLNLLSWLRQAGWTGSKEGCAEGECGACAVAIVEHADDGSVSRLVPVNSCLLPLAAIEGRHVVTVEGVAAPDGTLHPVQQALVQTAGSQCGYCTPGFVVSMFCEYHRPGRAGFDPECVAGNLCRCTGYRPIRDAVASLASSRPEPALLARFEARKLPVLSSEPSPQVSERSRAHISHGFVKPARLAEALDALAREPGARVISGGTDLMVEVNQRGLRFPCLISLESVEELRSLRCTDTHLEIGACVPLSRLEHWLNMQADKGPALLGQVLPLFASPLIRERATVAGSLATASPIGDLAPVLLALEAQLELTSLRGPRNFPLTDFFLGYRQTALAHDELITAIRIPLASPPRQHFYKVSKRVLDDISTVAAAFALELDDQRRVTQLRIAYAGVAATPLRARKAERAALGQPWSRSTWEAVRSELASVASPISDRRGSAAYRGAMITRLFERFCGEP